MKKLMKKEYLVAAAVLLMTIDMANAGFLDRFKKKGKKDHDAKIRESFSSGVGGIFGFGFGNGRKVKDLKYTEGESKAMEQGRLDAASEILEEAGKLGNTNLVAKYYIRDGRVFRQDRESWPKAAQEEYLVNYRGYPISKEIYHIQNRNERLMAEKARNEKLIAFLSYAQSQEEREIIQSLLLKKKYMTEEDFAYLGYNQPHKHIHQGARFGGTKKLDSDSKDSGIAKQGSKSSYQ